MRNREVVVGENCTMSEGRSFGIYKNASIFKKKDFDDFF